MFRLAQSEDIQYFQFDKDGNMYIFEGGAGCTGLSRKVEPGEELHWDRWNEVKVTEPKCEELSLEIATFSQDSQKYSTEMDSSSMPLSQTKRYYIFNCFLVEIKNFEVFYLS